MADIDMNDAKIQDAIASAVKTQVADSLKSAVEAEVQGLKSKNSELLEKMNANKGLSEADITELKEHRDNLKKVEDDKAIKAGEFEKLKEQLVSQQKIDLQKVADSATKMKSSLDRHLIDAAAISAIADAKGSTKLLLPHVKSHLKVIELDNGDYVARVVDSSGTVRIGDKDGSPMSIVQLVESMKTDDVFMAAFAGTGAGGGGSNGSLKNGKIDTSKMSSVQKIAHGLRVASGQT